MIEFAFSILLLSTSLAVINLSLGIVAIAIIYWKDEHNG